MTGADITKPTDEHRWMLYDIDFQTGKIRWEREIHAAMPQQTMHQKNSYASETPVTDGERVYVYFGYPGCSLRHGRRAGWSKPMDAQDPHGMGHRRLPGAPRRPALHRERQRGALVHGRLRRAHGHASLAHRSRREGSNWATPFVWQNEQAHRDCHDRQREGSSYDPNGKLLWELAGMTSIHAVTPFASHGLLFVSSGYFPDIRQAAVCHQAGRDGRHLAKGRRDEQCVHRLV